MKKEDEINVLLNQLADRTKEPVRPDLSDDIKHRIPHRLLTHRGGLDTIKIIIDLRINRLTAAAAIITTIIFCGIFLGGSDHITKGVLRDSMLIIKYWGTDHKSSILDARTKYELLLKHGKEVAWYGDAVNSKNKNAVIMQRKLSEGKYEIVFVDGNKEQVNSEELIRILSNMLQKDIK